MNENEITDLVLASVLTLTFSGIGYLWARGVCRGKALTKLQRSMLLYATFFVFGAAHLILFQDVLGKLVHWKKAWIAVMLLWTGGPGS